jgi:hypothetical protein
MFSERNKNEILKIYYVAQEKPTYDYIYALQKVGGFICYTDCKDIVNEYLNANPASTITILQFNIPPNKRYIIEQACKLTAGAVNGNPHAFSLHNKIRAIDVLNFDYYAGIWEHKKCAETNKVRSIFFPEVPILKQMYAESRKQFLPSLSACAVM